MFWFSVITALIRIYYRNDASESVTDWIEPEGLYVDWHQSSVTKYLLYSLFDNQNNIMTIKAGH